VGFATDLLKSISLWNLSRRRRRRDRISAHYHDTDHPAILGVLAIMKNESMNIDEWITHYLQVGAQKIYLIDNGSTDDTVKKAKDWVDQGVVELVEWPRQHAQKEHYWAAIKAFRIRETCRWLLIADLDEFWFCPDATTISDKLSNFQNIDVIYVNWRMFGSSGLVKHPQSIRTAFVHCDPKLYNHAETKFISRTSVIKNRKSVQVHKIDGANSKNTVSDNESFHLFHYRIQSLEYFETVKMTRGDVLSVRPDVARDMQYFNDCNTPCTEINRTLADLVETGRLGTTALLPTTS
jgi:hypothetical protein